MRQKKITVYLATGLHPFEMEPVMKFNDEFKENLIDKEEEIRTKIELPINDLVGGDWELGFHEFPVNEHSMNVDIKSDPTFYTPIAKIIVEAYPNISYMFFEKFPVGIWGQSIEVKLNHLLQRTKQYCRNPGGLVMNKPRHRNTRASNYSDRTKSYRFNFFQTNEHAYF